MADNKYKDKNEKQRTEPVADTVTVAPGEKCEIVGINFREAG